MTDRTIYQALAEAFRAEGVTAQFVLMGDGNMHWVTVMKDLPGVTTVHARHEHCAVGMAMGYASATGGVGVASVTCGPGITQITTALASAARSRVPVVVLAGDVPLKARFYGQAIDQQPLVTTCGAHYIAGLHPVRMHQYVREAFWTARHERRPVVLAIPYDLQKQPMPDIGPYVPSDDLIPVTPPLPPDPAQLDALARRLASARCPVLIAGRGVLAAGATDELAEVADLSGAFLSTTLLARGLYDAHPFSMGVAGGFARRVAREVFAEADLVVAIGASLTYHTVDGGRLIPPDAHVVQIDPEPLGLREGLRAADTYLRADARLAALGLLDRLRAGPAPAARMRTDALAARIRDEPADPTDYDIDPGTLDPRAVFAELETAIPGDWDVVSGSGHQSYFHTVMRGQAPGRYHVMRDFGAIGNAISYAIGVAVARGDGRVVLYEGDGSLLMHVQELECLQRQGIRLLVVCSNDGAYGAEIHKLREDGMDDSGAIFGRTDLGAIARGFGLTGETVTELGHFADLRAAYEAGTKAAVWNVHVSDKVVNPRMRLNIKAGHGTR
ncbi:thiamine pyrophosphate-binding protein [Silicimonas algicola]|uniref:Thiamine pyrophosphate-dependent acetolactate synthase large subunit-like protein n=1 Tax=Silicimonas algicola TaxID=1826607 RepID=A0A316G173_9RHOB|nr:thiamine pyrophosphate-binding protein [Silicimonas algicola]AZQ68265.1 thiamine pyrophosphate-binding protein [Silicimonas algicola]PWK54599.1 thiamine pyrophosphate-dependent acetolactate synthase large subunit-like protein [Silicimonas algicola]